MLGLRGQVENKMASSLKGTVHTDGPYPGPDFSLHTHIYLLVQPIVGGLRFGLSSVLQSVY